MPYATLGAKTALIYLLVEAYFGSSLAVNFLGDPSLCVFCAFHFTNAQLYLLAPQIRHTFLWFLQIQAVKDFYAYLKALLEQSLLTSTIMPTIQSIVQMQARPRSTAVRGNVQRNSSKPIMVSVPEQYYTRSVTLQAIATEATHSYLYSQGYKWAVAYCLSP